MIVKMTAVNPDISKLLALAASENKLKGELESYLTLANKSLYLSYQGNQLVGCIGIKELVGDRLEITHIATSESNRYQKVGSSMIDFILMLYMPSLIFAETDNEAVGFYQRYGFEREGLGEKYPGVERFYCSYAREAYKDVIN